MVKVKSQNISKEVCKDLEASYREFLETDLPFISILQDLKLWDKTKNLSVFLSDEFQTLVVVGIGGSHLGAESFLKALTFPRKVVFLENPDPVGINRRWSSIEDLSKTHFVFVSRSGNTLETSAISNWVIGQLSKLKLAVSKHCSVITAYDDSPLKVWADQNNVSSLQVPNDLSGRYSALSPVGVIPLLFGLPENQKEFFQKFYKGAEAALDEMEQALELSCIYKHIIENRFTSFNFWIYSDQMLGFGKWFRQLWSESLGQSNSPTKWNLPSVVLCKGASEQHSYLQQVIAQPNGQVNLVFTFKNLIDQTDDLLVEEDHIKTSWNFSGKSFSELFNIESKALIKTFDESGIPYLHLEIDNVDLASLVQFVMLQQLVISHLGMAAGIDPFVQPEVEKMKDRVLKLF